MSFDVALIMEGKYIAPSNADWYIQQVLDDDQALIDALNKLGLSSIKVDWRDSSFDWTRPKICIFRSVWDYFHHFDEFQEWLRRVETKNQFINSISQIKWNMDKHYLLALERKGIPIVRSYFVEIGDQRTLQEIHHDTGWQKTVLKPCVSGGGRHTYLLTTDQLSEHEEIFSQLIKKESMMLQPFQEQVITKGEVSHIVIGGSYTHSILKRAKAGDYRVQDDFGGSLHPYTPTKDEVEFAEQVVKACDPHPSYARVDVIWDNKGDLAVSELELIEPELWFRKHPDTAKRLALEIAQKIDH